MEIRQHPTANGPLLALLAAALFGISTPSAKLLMRQVDPWMLAGLLYLGSGIGLAAFRTIRTLLSNTRPVSRGVRGADWLWLSAAILAGGVIGPVLLMFGLARTTASTSALLLNLEGVFTTLI